MRSSRVAHLVLCDS